MANNFSNNFSDRYSVERAKNLASGRWDFVFNVLGANINFNPRVHTLCPKHGGTDGFRVFKDFQQTGGVVCNTCGSYPNGFKALCWLLSIDFNTCVRQVVDLLDPLPNKDRVGVRRKIIPLTKEEVKKVEKKVECRKASQWLFDQSKALNGWIAEGYLRERGIPLCFLDFSLRFNNETLVRDKNGELVKIPAIISAVRDTEMNLVTVHKTFLDRYRKSDKVPNPKLIAPLDEGVSIKGCAIYPRNISPTDDTILVAEGIETALSVYWQYKGTFTAALISSTIMPDYIPPKNIKKVVVFADKDRTGLGEEKALKLCDNLRKLGYKTAIALPKEDIPEGKKSIDWNDVLVNGGQFPDYELIANL